MSDDLIDRLRTITSSGCNPYSACHEAADELARLRAEVERLTKQLNDADTILGTYIVLFGDIFDKPAAPIKGLRGMLNAP